MLTPCGSGEDCGLPSRAPPSAFYVSAHQHLPEQGIFCHLHSFERDHLPKQTLLNVLCIR